MDLAVRGGQPEAATFYLRWHFGRKPIFHRCASARIAGKPAPTTAASNLWESPAAAPHNSCIKPVGAGLPAMISALRQCPHRRQAGSHNNCRKPVAAGLPAMISALRQCPNRRQAGSHNNCLNQTQNSKLTYDWPFAPPANRIHPCL